MLRLATLSIRALTLAVMLFTTATGTLQPFAHLCLATGLRMARPCCPNESTVAASGEAHLDRACCVSVSAAPRDALVSVERQRSGEFALSIAAFPIASVTPPPRVPASQIAPLRIAAGPPPAQLWRRLSPVLIV